MLVIVLRRWRHRYRRENAANDALSRAQYQSVYCSCNHQSNYSPSTVDESRKRQSTLDSGHIDAEFDVVQQYAPGRAVFVITYAYMRAELEQRFDLRRNHQQWHTQLRTRNASAPLGIQFDLINCRLRMHYFAWSKTLNCEADNCAHINSRILAADINHWLNTTA